MLCLNKCIWESVNPCTAVNTCMHLRLLIHMIQEYTCIFYEFCSPSVRIFFLYIFINVNNFNPETGIKCINDCIDSRCALFSGWKYHKYTVLKCLIRYIQWISVVGYKDQSFNAGKTQTTPVFLYGSIVIRQRGNGIRVASSPLINSCQILIE